MTYLLSLLPLLACPIAMGLMMWVMMRGNANHKTHKAQQANTDTSSHATGTTRSNPLAGLHLCLNWKVVTGLAAVGLVIWIVAPYLIWTALPLLIVAACPLSMLLMMRGMGGSSGANRRAREWQVIQAGSARDEAARN